MAVNKENLKLMEKINELERAKKGLPSGDLTNDFKIANESSLEERYKNSLIEEHNPALENTINNNNKTMLSKFKYSEYGNKENSSILNITEVVAEDSEIRQRYDSINKLQEALRIKKKENAFLSSQIGEINNNIFILTKLFTEGTHEISKELLKIHEIQLDKIVTSI